MGKFSKLINEIMAKKTPAPITPVAKQISYDPGGVDATAVIMNEMATPPKIELIPSLANRGVDIYIDGLRQGTLSEDTMAQLGVSQRHLLGVIHTALRNNAESCLDMGAVVKMLTAKPKPPVIFSNVIGNAVGGIGAGAILPAHVQVVKRLQPEHEAISIKSGIYDYKFLHNIHHDDDPYMRNHPNLIDLLQKLVFHAEKNKGLSIEITQRLPSGNEMLITLPLLDQHKHSEQRRHASILYDQLERMAERIASGVLSRFKANRIEPKIRHQSGRPPHQEYFETIETELVGKPIRLAFTPLPSITPYEFYQCRKVIEGLVPIDRMAFLLDHDLLRHWTETEDVNPKEMDPNYFHILKMPLMRWVCSAVWKK